MLRFYQWLRRKILILFKPLARRIGFIYLSWHHKKITAQAYAEISEVLTPGDILLSRTEGEFTNLFIPGFWGHAAIYVGEDSVVEAVSPTVKQSDLMDFVFAKDYICVLRPKFSNEDIAARAVEFALMEARAKIPYDYLFEPNEKAFYCAELVAFAYKVAMKGDCPFKWKLSMGVETVLPEDFANASDKFETLWCNREY